MAKLSITKIFTFEAANALKGYDGLCANIHGHSYRLEVTVRSVLPIQENSFLHSHTEDPKTGMLMDFSELKKIVNRSIIEPFDHSLFLNRDADWKWTEALQKDGMRIVLLPYQPTSENLLLDFSRRLQKVLPPHVKLTKLRLYETASSYTDWEDE